ncbi:MAG: U32 family peptidase [Bacilli bacterium]|nr:U32 family peptidase [Bacilli bacterium]
MKIIIEPTTKKEKYENVDGLLLSLKDYSVQSGRYYTLEEIKEIKKNNDLEIFISMNKNFMNEEIESVKEVLLEIDKLGVTGILFYDVALLQLKKEYNLKTDLVWASTYMVNNTKTCDYYYNKGVKYALLGKEITLEEIKEIIRDSSITSMVEVVGLPSVAFSKRKLITNLYSDLGKDSKDTI